MDVDSALAMAGSYTPDSLGAFVESDWFGTGEAADMPVSIPDADGAGASAMLEVSGLPEGGPTSRRWCWKSHWTMPRRSSSVSRCARPFGHRERAQPGRSNVALEYNPGIMNWHLLSNAFYGEDPNGTWALQVADLAAADTGSLSGWRLRIYYGDHGAN